MTSALAVAAGGALGALARFGAGRLIAVFIEQPFPWGTWVVNLVGCLLIGMTVPVFGWLSGAEIVRFFFVVGFLGSFTTFSTYNLDTIALWGSGREMLALVNAMASLGFGLILVAVGRELTEWVLATCCALA